MKVLVVHRQSTVLEHVKRELEPWFVKKMLSGLDGLLSARMERYDFVLCGLDLPVVTGIEMARSIRNFSYNRHVPIILLANGSETEDHFRIASSLNASFLTLDQVRELKEIKIDTHD
jgi:DNA-binding response OmpR family regulator